VVGELLARSPSVALATALLIAMPALAAVAQEPADARAKRLEEIRSEIARLGSQLEQLGARADDLLSRVARTRIELQLQSARLDEARTALAAASDEVASTRAAIEDLEGQLDELQTQLRLRLFAMHRYGGRGYLRLFLSIDPQADLLQALRQLRFLIRRDDLTLERYRQTRTQLEDSRRQLAERERESAEWVESEDQRARELRAVERRDQELLDELHARRERLLAESERLAEKEERFERLMTALFEEGGSQLAGTPIQDYRGALPWPADGPVQVEFGPRRDPTYGTIVPHNGVEIGAEPGEPVRAVYPGRVVFAAPFQDFGYTVVVQHAGQVLTLYAGLSRLLVSEGDVLTLEAVVGESSAALYFELRAGRHPENPRDWLL